MRKRHASPGLGSASFALAIVIACGGAAVTVTVPPTVAQTAAPAAPEAGSRPSFRDDRRWSTGPATPRPPTTGPAAASPPAAAPPAAGGDGKARGPETRQVVLRMKGGDLQIAGELRAFDGQRYVILSPRLGRMSLLASRFECQGQACTTLVAAESWADEPLSADRPEQIAIRGSDAVGAQHMPALIRAYAASIGATVGEAAGPAPDQRIYRLADARGGELATIDLQAAAADSALSALAGGTVALAMTDRPAREAEVEALATASGPPAAGVAAAVAGGGAAIPASSLPRRPGHNEHVLGTEGLAVIVAPDNPLSGLTLDALAKILSGQTTDWYELGLPPGRITLHGRTQAVSAHDRLTELVLQPRGLAPMAPTKLAATERELVEAVTRDRNGLAVVPFAAARAAKSLNIESACGLVHRPTIFSVTADEYPLSQRLYLYAPVPPRQAVARGLLSFATSREAQRVLAEAQVSGHGVESTTLDGQAERMATALNAPPEAFDLPQMRTMLADLKGARRLSTTFRFVPGTLDLDARSRLEVGQLATLLQTPEYAGKHVLLAGYTDAGGKFQANLTHAFKRSAQIRTAVLTAAGTGRIDARLIAAKGYGPLAPVACNGGAEGHRLNRRVEVWVRD